MLTTDNMPPAGSNYRIEGGVVRSEDGTIAGSALHIDQAVRNLMAYADIPFEQAIVHATNSPARLLGLEREMGMVAAGRRADLAVWDDAFMPIATFVGGSVVHGAAHLYRPTKARA